MMGSADLPILRTEAIYIFSAQKSHKHIQLKLQLKLGKAPAHKRKIMFLIV